MGTCSSLRLQARQLVLPHGCKSRLSPVSAYETEVGTRESSSERLVKNILRVTRKQYSSEEKIRIVLDGLRGECSIAELCRREGIAESLYYSWSKEFLEAGKRRLPGHRHAGRSAATAASR